MDQESDKRVESAVNQLAPRYRMVFILREIQQTPVSETASFLTISEENVKVRLHRAKGMPKDILRAELSSLEIFEFHESRCARVAMNAMSRI
jgi:DNA-directed RNA polymerase specialized sigma24 family protein